MLNDPSYDQVRLLHELSRTCHFVKKHALPSIQKQNQPLTAELYKELAADLEKHIEKLRQAIEGLSREGKFK